MTGSDEEHSTDETDPFDRLSSDMGDRDGDPFENLSEDDPSQKGGSETAVGGADTEQESGEPAANRSQQGGGNRVDEFGIESSRAPAQGQDESGPGEPAGSGPVDAQRGESDPVGINRDVGRRPGDESDLLGDVGDREGDPFEEGGSLFEKREADGVDPETVWQDLASADSRGGTGDAHERTFADVSKHSYCEQCEHFSPPPDVACTNEGTDIVEFLDIDTVRVVDCPVVAERQELDSEE